jgi:hypothetical protein
VPRNGAYGVVAFDRPTYTIIASGKIDNSPVAVADPRAAPPAYVVLSYEETKRVVDGEVPVPFAIVDPQRPGEPLAIVDDLKKPPFRWIERTVQRTTKQGKVISKTTRVRETVALVLISEDGTWHRPLTTLELAVLQAFPAQHEGKPLDLGVPAGTRGRKPDQAVTAQREVIGNAVPPKVAEAMSGQVLLSLMVAAGALSAMGAFGTDVWVRNLAALRKQLRAEGFVVVAGTKPLNFTTGEQLDDGDYVWKAQSSKGRRASAKGRRPKVGLHRAIREVAAPSSRAA